MIPFSVLDLAPIVQGGDARSALAHSAELAQHAERLGYERFWLAEHHGMPGIASAATAVVIGHVAAHTSRIRVGAGGIMLPNHAPLVVAEQFGTLEALFPGRIDLGLGRAPGTDPVTSRALRRNLASGADHFVDDVRELMAYFEPARPEQIVRAVPGEGADVAIWILGSSLFGAQVAAQLGLPFAFASHFAPLHMMEAISIYRARFQPSAQLAAPRVMLGLNVVTADSDADARHLFTSLEQAFVSLRRGRPGPLPPPVEPGSIPITPLEQLSLAEALACSVVGSESTVRQGLADFIARTSPDELIITSHVYDHAARLRSFELTARAGRAQRVNNS